MASIQVVDLTEFRPSEFPEGEEIRVADVTVPGQRVIISVTRKASGMWLGADYRVQLIGPKLFLIANRRYSFLFDNSTFMESPTQCTYGESIGACVLRVQFEFTCVSAVRSYVKRAETYFETQTRIKSAIRSMTPTQEQSFLHGLMALVPESARQSLLRWGLPGAATVLAMSPKLRNYLMSLFESSDRKLISKNLTKAEAKVEDLVGAARDDAAKADHLLQTAKKLKSTLTNADRESTERLRADTIDNIGINTYLNALRRSDL